MPVVDHFPTVGHLKCTVKAVYIKSFGGQKGGSSEPPRTPSAYGPGYTGVGITRMQQAMVLITIALVLAVCAEQLPKGKDCVEKCNVFQM